MGPLGLVILLFFSTTLCIVGIFFYNHSTSSQPTESVNAWYQTVDCLHDWEKSLQLGDAYLHTTARSECAQARFTIGLLALHNFQYDLAVEMFEDAAAVEEAESGRGYPMALWGAAMATTHILWQYSDCERGKKFLHRIPNERDWLTKKENDFIETGFALYPNDLTCAQDNNQFLREKRFVKGMKKLAEQYPEETEATLFYALTNAAISAHPECVDEKCVETNKKNYHLKKTIKTLEALEAKHPKHSGVIHYITHIFDTPELYYEGNEQFLEKMIKPSEQQDHPAAMGLRAANNYLQVATSSCHGLHMPSHIFMRFGNWTKSLQSNLMSIKACDEFSKQRGFAIEDLHDADNLYHSIEFAQYDYLQRGQYVEANKLLLRMNDIISKLGGTQRWNKTKELIWVQQRMSARQLIESFGVGKILSQNLTSNPQKCQKVNATDATASNSTRIASNSSRHECTEETYGSLLPEPITDGEMIYASISEYGMFLLHVLHEVKICAEDKNKSCLNNTILSWTVKESEKVSQELQSRPSVFEYTKNTAHMLHQVILGMIDLAENIRPHGLNCYARKNCTASKVNATIQKTVTGALRKATEIQKSDMIQSSATASLLFMPSYEIYGHVLLFLQRYVDAKEMFEASLKERMGRTLSLLGLARSHAMLGNTQKADYFYNYLMAQLQEADNDNPVVEEAKQWFQLNGQVEAIRDHWFWPYFSP